jgi:hypothetical protein
MNLFKAFPRFGAMILGQRNDQAGYSTLARVLGCGLPFQQRGNLWRDVSGYDWSSYAAVQ